MVEQKTIELCGVKIPIIIEDGVEYYPISYLSEKVLLRKGSILPNNKNTEKYSSYIKKYVIDMSFLNAGKQECRCISFDGLKEILLNLRSGRLSKEQKRRMNLLNKYLDVNKEVVVKDRFCNKPSANIINTYSEFIKDAIQDVLLENEDIIWQCCNKCGNIYPFHENFFKENKSSPYKLDTYCKVCKGWDHNRARLHIKRNDDYLNKIHSKYGESFYVLCRDHKTIDIYNFYIENEIYAFPEIISNKDDVILIIKYLYENGIVNKDNLTYDNLKVKCRINRIKEFLNLHDIYEMLCGKEYFLYPWKYKSFKYYSDSVELNRDIAVKVYKNYLDEHGIKIKNTLDYDYISVAKKCCISSHVDEDILSFVVDLNDRSYGGYRYKINGVNYYKEKENRIFDLKWYIENELKVEIEKIPLYLTVTSLHNNALTLYNVFRKYYVNLYWWVNEVYPDRFIEADFNVGLIRNEFDSIAENQIHNVLKNNLNNVIYNQRNTDNTITVGGYNPDWIVITDHGCWIVEYFGWYDEKLSYNPRVEKYIEKTHKKIDKYGELNNINKLYIYPYDLKNGYLGLLEKIKNIV